jgi:carbamoyltransferase
MENGARALGNRSILVHPGFQDMKIKINREVKRREAFRPFAPSVLTENASDWFCFDAQGYPEETHKWMIQAAPAREHSKKIIPAVTHIDGSVRPQLVSAEDNPRYYKLIKSFANKTGIPVLLNTSFNVRGEPIICKPDEAIKCFFSHGIDVLVMGNIVLRK